MTKRRLWRRVGTAVVRWPAPIFAASAAVVLVGMIGLPGYKTSYNDPPYLPGKERRPILATRPLSSISPTAGWIPIF